MLAGMKRRDFLRAAGGAASVLAIGGCGGSRRAPFRVLFLTDFHARAELGAPEALARVADQVNRIAPDLVIGGGDCIHGGFAGDLGQSRRRLAIFREFAESIRAPAHWIIGNHDFARAVDSGGEVLPGDPTALFRETMGVERLYSSFDAGGVHWIALQSVDVVGGQPGYRGFVDREQLAWLRDNLGRVPRGRPVVLITHIPLRSTFLQQRERSTAALTANLVVENANEVLSCLAGHRLLAVLQGHLHSDERIHWNDTAFIMGGAVCGAWWQGANQGTEEGYGQLDLDGGALAGYRYLDSGWSPPATAATQ